MRTLNISIARTICIAVLLLLTACSFPFIQILSTQPSATPTEEVAVTAQVVTPQAATEAPFDFDAPTAGEAMLWVDSSTVVFVPGGEFIMGYDETTPSDHHPAHTVTLDSYWIYQAEVTNQMYAACVALGVCSVPDVTENEWYSDAAFSNAPVTGVTYAQAQTYCEWVDARLPTEAEWELAARGTQGATYPWGEDDPACSLLNFEDCLDPSEPQTVRSLPLGASPYNLADMAGNAAEWVFDWYGEEYYQTAPVNNPTGPAAGTERVVRGSSFNTPEDELQIYLRSSLDPLDNRADLGFRCVLTGETTAQPVVPMCDVLSYSPTWPDHDPFPNQFIPIPDAIIQLYCNLRPNGDMYNTLGVRLAEGTDPDMITIESSYGPITCEPDAGDPLLFNCWGAGLHPGSEFTIEVCPLPLLVDESPVAACPIYYQFNSATNLCEYRFLTGPVVCDPGTDLVPGYGCLPMPDGLGECPVGFYSADYHGNPICVPASLDAYCSPGGVCAATCPEGLTFNPDELCCDYPPDVAPVCPLGYYFVLSDHMCHPIPIQIECRRFEVTGPTCAPVETQQPQTGCLISSVSHVGMDCVSPCPVGVPNFGPCTP